MGMFAGYSSGLSFDELIDASGQPRPYAKVLVDAINDIGPAEFERRQALADLSFVQSGVTFTVYSDSRGTEKTFPFDLIPRLVPGSEWTTIEAGLAQRLTALNLFLHDVYHEQKVLKDGIIPREIVIAAAHFRPEFIGADPPGGVYVHIAGSDLIRSPDGFWQVLEDNLRTPSGVSYMLENRAVLTRIVPDIFRNQNVRPIHHYAAQLIANLRALAPDGRDNPNVVILTPGSFNSAYFEHAYLAQQLGVPLVEGRDLVVADNIVYMKTTHGLQRVDVIYRRIDDDFLDPLTFRPDSVLGCPGIVNSYRGGNVALANSIGTGVADDKVVYAYVPELIRYYLDQEPIVGNVETFLPWRPADLEYIIDNIGNLVVKAANESGGYGMLIGPKSTLAEQADFADKVRANPRNYIAQPLIELSTAPTYVNGDVDSRHVDLRPFALYGRDGRTTIVPGGLTRVALTKGSYVVNSSQGGGSKDTWVVDTDTTSEVPNAIA